MLPRVDEATVRQHAQAHGDAVVAGDLRRAGSDLDGEALAQAGEVMKQLPRTLTAAEIESLELEGDVATVRTRYSGDEGSGVVESRWEERDGRPKIVHMRVG
jgi:hypothetical protein